MRKTSVLFLAICLILLSACTNESKTTEQTDITSQSNPISTSASSIPINNSETATNEFGCGTLNPQKYRICFYQIPAFFSGLVDKNTYDDWCSTYFDGKYPDDTNEMVIVSFIKEFNISREAFDKANVEYGRFIEKTYGTVCMNPQDYADQEFTEVYNADIIYTFDNSVISDYYLGNDYPFFFKDEYQTALEAGTYETRTTDWIDVDEMEAEINAKYGEPDSTTSVTE